MLVIIPAKKNSRRLKSKNKKFLGTMPLISWSINCAKKLTQNKNIIVSTNCKSIAKIAEKEKCKIPFFRPDNLTKDNTTMFEVANHVVNEYEKKMKKKIKYDKKIFNNFIIKDDKLIIPSYWKVKNV